MRGHFAIAAHRFSLRAIKNSLTTGRAFTLFPPENNCRRSFCAKTPASQFWSGIDFPSVYRKSYICGLRLRPGTEVICTSTKGF
jgi:hypothetical protein